MPAWFLTLLIFLGQAALVEPVVELPLPLQRGQIFPIAAHVRSTQHEVSYVQKSSRQLDAQVSMLELSPSDKRDLKMSAEDLRDSSWPQPLEVDSGGEVLKLEFAQRSNANVPPAAAMELLSGRVLQFPDETVATAQKKIHPVITPPPTSSHQWWALLCFVGFFGAAIGICAGIITTCLCGFCLIQDRREAVSLAQRCSPLAFPEHSQGLREGPRRQCSTMSESNSVRSTQGPEIHSMASGGKHSDNSMEDEQERFDELLESELCACGYTPPTSTKFCAHCGRPRRQEEESTCGRNSFEPSGRKSSISLRYDALDSLRQHYKNRSPSNSSAHSSTPPEARNST